MLENENQSARAGAPVAETQMQKYEREQLSRRAALRRMGYTSALAAFALFGADDVVRLVSRKMQQQAGDSRLAELVAGELQNSGVVVAGTPPAPCGSTNTNCSGCKTQGDIYTCCTQAIMQNQPGSSTCCYSIGQAQQSYMACQACCLSVYRDDVSGGKTCQLSCPNYIDTPAPTR